MDWILTVNSGHLKKMINAYLPVVALLTIILILPVIFEWIAISYEGQKTRSGIDASITSRYFNYQVSIFALPHLGFSLVINPIQ